MPSRQVITSPEKKIKDHSAPSTKKMVMYCAFVSSQFTVVIATFPSNQKILINRR
jgi:hypothetical protein